MSAPLRDAEARARIQDDLATTLVVEAAAGTGKTTALIGRMISVLRSGRGVLDRMVALTFTDKAAGEMKLRLRTELERARQAATGEERGRFEDALRQLEAAHIGTIHSFCGDVLGEWPLEAGVDPAFEIGADERAVRLFDEAFEDWFQTVVQRPPEGVRRLLRRTPPGGVATGPSHELRRAARLLVEHRDFPLPWRRDALERHVMIDVVVERLTRLAMLAERASNPRDPLARGLRVIKDWVDELEVGEAIRQGGRDYDRLEHQLADLMKADCWKRKGRGRAYGEGLPRDQVLAERSAVQGELQRVVDACRADLAACLHRDLRPLVETYESLKLKAGVLDFLDLLIRTRDLLVENAEVRRHLQERFTHLFVDEFQDTDPLQAEIMLLLAADDPGVSHADDARPVRGKVFLVADPKQAIYRFRRADVALYTQLKERLLSQGAELLHLTTSFRAPPSIQEAINAAFAPQMRATPDGSQAEYVALDPYRSDVSDRPTVVALPVPRPFGDGGYVTKKAVSESLPDAVGAFVDYLLRRSGWQVLDAERRMVPIETRHICLLFRRFQAFGEDVARPYLRALEARRIPHVLVGGRSFFAREEIMAVRTALQAIEWPDDDLCVFATLRGPLFSVSDDALLDFTHDLGRLHPLRRFEPEQVASRHGDVISALTVLGRLHVGRNRRPVAETVGALLAQTRAQAGIAIWPTGEQSLGNVLRLVDQARRFDRQGATSFRAFIEHLSEREERGETPEAPMVEEGVAGVRMMTVHGAKGLEFPVVILCDPTAPRTSTRPSRYVDKASGLWAQSLAGCAPIELHEHADEVLRHDAEEEVRIAYVAATRARELLVVPASGVRPVEGWVDVMHEALYPSPGSKNHPSQAPGCPRFGNDSVYEATINARHEPHDSVAPGQHTPQQGSHQVVWWDPHALELDMQPARGLRQLQLLSASDASGDNAVARTHRTWQTRTEQALREGARPTTRAQPVTAVAAAHAAAPPQVDFEHTDLDRTGRPGGKRFGSLVHAVLAEVALDADEAQIHRMARAQSRLLGASDQEQAAAAGAVLAALTHPVMLRARASKDCRRETPITLRLDDTTFIEGVADLAFREATADGTRWVVVDYKTDADPTEHPQYATQLDLYRRAIETATGCPTVGILLAI